MPLSVKFKDWIFHLFSLRLRPVHSSSQDGVTCPPTLPSTPQPHRGAPLLVDTVNSSLWQCFGLCYSKPHPLAKSCIWILPWSSVFYLFPERGSRLNSAPSDKLHSPGRREQEARGGMQLLHPAQERRWQVQVRLSPGCCLTSLSWPEVTWPEVTWQRVTAQFVTLGLNALKSDWACSDWAAHS